MNFIDAWRRRKSAAFDLEMNSTARRAVELDLWGRSVRIYANANLSIYSAQACNARCPFCVEELRPASRGTALELQKRVEVDDERYFARLEAVLDALRPLDPSVSVTGGEPSIDPRLPAIFRTLSNQRARKCTMTTNGTGLLQVREGRQIIDWITATGLSHLNISRAHPDQETNARLMRLHDGLSVEELREVVARSGTARVRLSCVLLRGAIDDLDGIRRYLDFAAELGVDNVIFRQLMKTDPATHTDNFVVRYSDTHRVLLEPLLDGICASSDFTFQRQIVGYYYYVEVWKYAGMDVVFEEADLAQLEAVKRRSPDVIHELVFHPNAVLASTWQPWDGILGPGDDALGSTRQWQSHLAGRG
jgi:molybdenum cofactor biosynthesis enzyme MoaA